MIGRPEIQRLAQAGGVDERTQERDYLLTWMLAAHSAANYGLVFKGGTCLRQCYFRGYRYSEDLDFTLPAGSSAPPLIEIIGSWCAWVSENSGIRATASPDDQSPDQKGWLSFRGPLGAQRDKAVKVDVAFDEHIEDKVVSRPLLSDYTDIADQEHPVMAYSLVEMWAEKTRSLLQRAEPRDLYDLAMLAAHDKGLPARAHGVYVRKAELKKLDPNALAERLDRRKPVLAKLAGEEGFEPSIPCSRDRCLTVRPLASEPGELRVYPIRGGSRIGASVRGLDAGPARMWFPPSTPDRQPPSPARPGALACAPRWRTSR